MTRKTPVLDGILADVPVSLAIPLPLTYRALHESDSAARATLDQPPPQDTWLAVQQFHAQSSDHRPVTRAALRYTPSALLLWFNVNDRYVVCRHTGFQQPVCRDSCVEFFFQPPSCQGYFNLEINCGGAILMAYGSSLQQRSPLPVEALRRIEVRTMLPAIVDPERSDATSWSIACTLPYEVLAAAPLRDCERRGITPAPGDVWRANFYKCADASSHPHWAAWSDIGHPLSFHQPQRFSEIHFTA